MSWVFRIMSFAGLLLLGAALHAHAQLQPGDSLIHLPAPNAAFAQFAGDGAHFLTRQVDTVRVWDVDTRQQMGLPIAVGSGNCCVSFLPGDTTILTLAYNRDSSFKIWDWRSGKLVRKVNLFRLVSEAAVTGDGRHLIINVSVPAKQYEEWDINKGTYVDAFYTSEHYFGVQVDSAGRYAVIKSPILLLERLVRVKIDSHQADTVPVYIRQLLEYYVSHDGSRIACSRSTNPPIIFDALSLDSLFRLEIDMQNVVVIRMAFGWGRQRIVTLTTRSSKMPDLELWNGTSGTLDAHLSSDTSLRGGYVCLSPQDDYVLVYNLSRETILIPISMSTTDVPVVAGVLDRHLEVYPNPCHTELTIDVRQPKFGTMRLTLVSQCGAPVRSIAYGEKAIGHYTEHMATSGLSAGMYFCVIETANERRILPVIIEH